LPSGETSGSDPIKHEGKALQSVARGRLELGQLEDEAEKKEQEREAGEFKALVEKMKTALGESVKDVRVTLRLTDSPACLIADEHDLSANLQRLLKNAGQKTPASKPILEINPHHRLLARLKVESDEARFKDLSQILYDQALLAEGGTLEDPAGFVRRMNQLLLEMSGSDRET
jgi:molecular chaperone HtpG